MVKLIKFNNKKKRPVGSGVVGAIGEFGDRSDNYRSWANRLDAYEPIGKWNVFPLRMNSNDRTLETD